MTDITLQLKATATEEGFDILAISEGEAKGHGITFSSAILQDAMHLYNNKPVFIDHAGLFEAPSVRNLAGTIASPGWSMAEKGITATLRPSGPAADVLLSIRDAAKKDPAIMEAVGFSSVINVKLDTKGNVTKIVRVKSVDVVVDPARGGKFLSTPAPLTKGGQMKNKVKVQVEDPETEEITEVEGTLVRAPSLHEQEIEANQLAAARLLGETQRQQEMDAQLAQSRNTLIAMCEHLLTTGLSASRLPDIVQKRIRKQFNGRTFEAVELQTAITEAREELAALTEARNVQGPARSGVGGMITGAEEYKAALADLLGAPRETEMQGKRVRPLTGIREAYTLATGDVNFMGGYYPEYQLVTANFPSITADLLNKVLIQAWADYEQVYGWWQKIATVEHFTNLNDVKWIRTGTIASLPSVSERGEYTELPIGDNKESASFTKYGGYIPLTIEAVLKDDVRAFQRMPREAAMAGIRNVSEQVAAIFTQASGAGPTLADTGALFNSTPVTTAGGHANLLTAELGTDYTAWNAAAKAVFDQPLLVKNASGSYGAGKKQALDPSFVLVPRALKNAAEALFVPRWEATAQNVGAVSPSWGGRVEVLTVPEWTDAKDWAAAIDPKFVPGVMIGEIFGVKPQIFSAASEIDPAMFANDESRIKVRQFLAVGVADFRPLHKNNAT